MAKRSGAPSPKAMHADEEKRKRAAKKKREQRERKRTGSSKPPHRPRKQDCGDDRRLIIRRFSWRAAHGKAETTAKEKHKLLTTTLLHAPDAALCGICFKDGTSELKGDRHPVLQNMACCSKIVCRSCFAKHWEQDGKRERSLKSAARHAHACPFCMSSISTMRSAFA